MNKNQVNGLGKDGVRRMANAGSVQIDKRPAKKRDWMLIILVGLVVGIALLALVQ